MSGIGSIPSGLDPRAIADINARLQESWDHYKKTMIASNGRPLADRDANDYDKDKDNTERITHSEAVSYVLLRAVIMNEKDIFDRTWEWAQKNLQRKNIEYVYSLAEGKWIECKKTKEYKNRRDHLFAWKYFPTLDMASYSKHGRDGGVLVEEDCFTPATDADEDIAAALLMANNRWGKTGNIDYFSEARLILNDIWDFETEVIAGQRVLLGSDMQWGTKDPMTGKSTYGVNPSYFRPSYYTGLFKAFDPSHPWESLVSPSYAVLKRTQSATMHAESYIKRDSQTSPSYTEGVVEVRPGSRLVPDWIALDDSGAVRDHGWDVGDHDREGRKDYFADGDAFRTHFWLGLQHATDPKDEFASAYCGQTGDVAPYPFLNGELKSRGTILSAYDIDGQIHQYPSDIYRRGSETLSALGVYMAYFWASGDTESAEKIRARLDGQYRGGMWAGFPYDKDSEYYGANWVWFGLALMSGKLSEAFRFDVAVADRAARAWDGNIGQRAVAGAARALRKAMTKRARLAGNVSNRDYMSQNEQRVNLALDQKGKNELDKAQANVERVMGQQWKGYGRTSPSYDNAVLTYNVILVGKAEAAIFAKNNHLALYYVEKAKGLLEDGSRTLNEWEVGLRRGYFLEKLRLAAFAKKKFKRDLWSPEEIESFFLGATKGCNSDLDRAFNSNFIAIQAYLFYGYYLESSGTTEKEIKEYRNKAITIYKEAIEHMKDFTGGDSAVCEMLRRGKYHNILQRFMSIRRSLGLVGTSVPATKNEEKRSGITGIFQRGIDARRAFNLWRNQHEPTSDYLWQNIFTGHYGKILSGRPPEFDPDVLADYEAKFYKRLSIIYGKNNPAISKKYKALVDEIINYKEKESNLGHIGPAKLELIRKFIKEDKFDI